MDKVSKRIRSKVMASVKSKGNKSTELAFLKILRANKISGWRRHYHIKGKPDFCWPENKVAIFIDGCLWHGCPKFDRFPKSNKAFWHKKIEGNKLRDKFVGKQLREAGWVVVRIWECQVDNKPIINKIQKALSIRDQIKEKNSNDNL